MLTVFFPFWIISSPWLCCFRLALAQPAYSPTQYASPFAKRCKFLLGDLLQKAIRRKIVFLVQENWRTTAEELDTLQ